MYGIPVKMIIAIVIMTAAFFVGYKAGHDSCKADQVEAIEEADQQEKVKIKTVIKWKEKQKVVFRDKIKYIKQAPKNECLDADLRDIGLDSMFKRGGGETKSSFVNAIRKAGSG